MRVLIALIPIALILLFFSVHVVPPGNCGVTVSLGAVSPTVAPSGVMWHLPWAYTEDISVQQKREDGMADCFSSDLQTVKIHYAVLYALPADHVIALYTSYAGDPYHGLVDSRVQECLKQVTAGYAAESLVKSREQMREAVIARVRSNIGGLVNVVDINIANIDLTDALEKAIESKMVKQQESLATQYALDKARKDADRGDC